jgi:integrase
MTVARRAGYLKVISASGAGRQWSLMRKRILDTRRLTTGADSNAGWRDITQIATVEVSSEDRAMFATLLGCGLRRSELANLTMKHVQQLDSRWCIVDLLGKHGRVRTVPMPAWVKNAIDAWSMAAGVTEGHLFRPVNRGDQVCGDRMSEKVVWQMLTTYVARAGLSDIAPHDLRRTTAKLCRAAGGELEQIQLLLGHSSVQTTERYLGTKQDLAHAPNDAIKLKLAV